MIQSLLLCGPENNNDDEEIPALESESDDFNPFLNEFNSLRELLNLPFLESLRDAQSNQSDQPQEEPEVFQNDVFLEGIQSLFHTSKFLSIFSVFI